MGRDRSEIFVLGGKTAVFTAIVSGVRCDINGGQNNGGLIIMF
nr:hypothetical protein [Candidatus Freyarchaeota archaeon]